MKKIDLNSIPKELSLGTISTKEAINLISTYINNNYPVFGLHKYDEDFRAEILLSIIEKGETILEHYDKNQGEFFTFIFCYISSLVRTKLRSLAKKKINESIAISESAKSLEEKEYKYNHINYKCLEKNPLSYPQTPFSTDELKTIFRKVKLNKGLLIIAMKSAFYLNDNQIEKLSSKLKINNNYFFNTIQYCRSLLLYKSYKKQMIIDRRNTAYYHHKKYEKQLQQIEDSEFNKNNVPLKNYILEKENKQYKNWAKLNEKLNNGLITLRPTNKAIADILGICERQVSYYIKRTKKHYNLDNSV